MEYRQIGIADKNNEGAVKLLQEHIKQSKEIAIKQVEKAQGFLLFAINGAEISESGCVTNLGDLARIGLSVEEWRKEAPRMALQLMIKTAEYLKNKQDGDQNV
jgi:hypothetical protein